MAAIERSRHATSDASGWVVATTPVFIARLGWVLPREMMGWPRVTGISLAASGVLLVVTRGDLTSLSLGQFSRPKRSAYPDQRDELGGLLNPLTPRIEASSRDVDDVLCDGDCAIILNGVWLVNRRTEGGTAELQELTSTEPE